jgi:hypothetical protein
MARTVEPDTAPPAETYFPLILGPTILESTPTRFYSLRCKIISSHLISSQLLVILGQLKVIWTFTFFVIFFIGVIATQLKLTDQLSGFLRLQMNLSQLRLIQGVQGRCTRAWRTRLLWSFRITRLGSRKWRFKGTVRIVRTWMPSSSLTARTFGWSGCIELWRVWGIWGRERRLQR